MKKVKIKIEVNDYIIEEVGTIENEELKLKTKEENLEYDLKNNVLYKENNELKITMDFKNEIVTYELIKENRKFSNNLTTFSLTNCNKQVIINYRIEGTKFLLQINYETII